MNDKIDFKSEIEKYRLILKEKLDFITGLDWIVETDIDLWHFVYMCTFEDFRWETMCLDMMDLMRERNTDKVIENQAILIAQQLAREKKEYEYSND